jgi:type 1 fimbria pilin
MNSLIKAAVATAIMSASISSAFAGTDAHVEITGNVTDVTCDLGPGGNAPTSIFLGNRKPGDFTQAALGPYSNLFTVADTAKTFNVTVSGCSGASAVDGKTFGIKVLAYGATMNGDATLFGQMASPFQTSTAGAAISATGLSGTKTLVADNDVVPVYTYATGDTVDKVNGMSVPFETVMASEAANPTVGGIYAPVTFTIDYQ